MSCTKAPSIPPPLEPRGPDLKLDRRQGKHWDLDSALAYIESDQPSNAKSKKKNRKSGTSLQANNMEQPRANNTTPSKPVGTAVTSESEDVIISSKPAINAVTKLASVEDDLEKNRLKKDVEELQVQLAAEASGHARVASNLRNLKIEVASLKESNSSLQEEVTLKKKLLQESQKELEQNTTLLIKEQQLRRQSESNARCEVASMASKQEKLEVQVQALLEGQEKLQAALTLETNRRLSVEQELKRMKVAAEEEQKRAARSINENSHQSAMLGSQMPNVVRQLGDQQHQPSLAFCHSGGQVDNRQQMDQYLREEQEQMENFRKLKQMEMPSSGKTPPNGLMDPYHPHPHTPTLVKQSMKSGQVKELHCQERLFGKNVNVTTISASENGAVEASQGPFLSNTLRSQTTSAHARLVERLQERKNLLPIAPSECSRLVMKLRTMRGGLSGLTMDQIEEEVRKLAREDARSRERECPICFDLMLTETSIPGQLLRCVQCNHAFHFRCLEGWVSKREAKAGKAGCPICRAGTAVK